MPHVEETQYIKYRWNGSVWVGWVSSVCFASFCDAGDANDFSSALGSVRTPAWVTRAMSAV